MAVRPLVTTGAALLSAGALVAATPALFVPKDEIAIAAPAAVSKPSLSVDQLRLLALSNITPEALYQVFFQGYGGIVTGEENGDCGADDAVCPAGFVGVPYFIIDQALPPGFTLDNVFFEQGVVPIIQSVVVAAAEVIDPTGSLDLVDRVNDFFEGGVTQLVGNFLLDNLPEDTVPFGLTKSFFFGYGAHAGFVGAFTYVVDAILQNTADPDPTSEIPTPVADDSEGGGTQPDLVADNTGDPADPSITGNPLITLTTNPDVKSPLALKLAKIAQTPVVEPEVEPEAETEVEPVKTQVEPEVTPEVEDEGTDGAEDLGGTTSGGTVGAVTPVTNVDPQPEAPVEDTEEVKTEPVKEVKETETDTETVDTKDGNKATPGVIWQTGGGSKSPTNGWEKLGRDIQNGVNTLNKIFNKGKTTPKPAADTDDSGADNGGSEGGGEE